VRVGVPFPSRQCGNEAMWNFLLRYQGVSIDSKYDSWNVDSAGVPSLATTGQAFISYPIYENLSQPISSADVYYQMKLSYTGPARRPARRSCSRMPPTLCNSRVVPGSTCRVSVG